MRPYLHVFVTICSLLFLTPVGRAQNKNNDLLINFGLSSGYGYPSGLPSRENSGIPTANLCVEYSLSKVFSLGIYGAYTYSFFKFEHPQVGYKDVWKGWDVGIRSTFHIGSLLLKNEKTDLYFAAFAGYTARALVYDKSNIYRDSLSYRVDAISLGGILGFRYLISRKFGLYGEAGFSRKFFAGGGVSFNINSKE